ncbi:hypothetical protein FH972_008353 [Carpinus fangiana]|uniref:Uncharacterized protein n=1 Tax=Carpinus fangiana TaxID=176857 RepID=A0A5N6QYE1_9ROSI|nr:hypothetical protein FH972_008353 [Carpinus fangiana]
MAASNWLWGGGSIDMVLRCGRTCAGLFEVHCDADEKGVDVLWVLGVWPAGAARLCWCGNSIFGLIEDLYTWPLVDMAGAMWNLVVAGSGYNECDKDGGLLECLLINQHGPPIDGNPLNCLGERIPHFVCNSSFQSEKPQNPAV